MSWRKKYLSALEGKKNLRILSRLLSLHVIKASWFEPREKCSVKYKLTSSNENDIIVSAIASMDLPINSNLGHPASEVQKHTSLLDSVHKNKKTKHLAYHDKIADLLSSRFFFFFLFNKHIYSKCRSLLLLEIYYENFTTQISQREFQAIQRVIRCIIKIISFLATYFGFYFQIHRNNSLSRLDSATVFLHTLPFILLCHQMYVTQTFSTVLYNQIDSFFDVFSD